MGWNGRIAAAAACAGVLCAGFARADEVAAPDRPTDREIRRAMDAYLGDARADVSLVGGPGDAGWDGSYFLRAGPMTFRSGLLFQTRWEGFDWDDSDVEPTPGGDLTGFSLPRVTWWLGGETDCAFSWYAELEFGHPVTQTPRSIPRLTDDGRAGTVSFDADRLQTLREGWIGWQFVRSQGWAPSEEGGYEFDRWRFAAGGLSVGLVRTVGPWQLMCAPEEQQFIDVSLASSWIGMQMPGFTDRNRDFGIRFDDPFRIDWGRHRIDSVFTITNGEGPGFRNVINEFADDHVGFGGRLDWSFSSISRRLRFSETGVRQHEGETNFGAGLWAYSLHDARLQDRFCWGADAHVGWGGLTAQAGYQYARFDDDDVIPDAEGWSWNLQVGYLFPGTSIEVAGRATGFKEEFGGASEYGAAVNYYVDGPRNRLSLDATWIRSEDEGNFLGSAYPGYNPTFDGDGLLVRLQWQLGM